MLSKNGSTEKSREMNLRYIDLQSILIKDKINAPISGSKNMLSNNTVYFIPIIYKALITKVTNITNA